jgi:hypothetical protein
MKDHEDFASWPVPNYLSWIRYEHAMFVEPIPTRLHFWTFLGKIDDCEQRLCIIFMLSPAQKTIL